MIRYYELLHLSSAVVDRKQICILDPISVPHFSFVYNSILPLQLLYCAGFYYWKIAIARLPFPLLFSLWFPLHAHFASNYSFTSSFLHSHAK